MEWKHLGRPKRARTTVTLNLMTTNHPQQTPDNPTTKPTSSSSSSSSSDNNNNKKKKKQPSKKPENNNNKELMLKASSSSLSLSSSSSASASASSSSSSSDVVELSDLPCSVLTDILGRLPLKSLINCRYVCKTWKCLLAESYFYRLYSHHLPTALILEGEGHSSDTLTKICIVEHDAAISPPRPGSLTRKIRLSNPTFPNLLNPSNFRYLIGNSCNGLICLCDFFTREPVVVWSPIMGQYVVLPSPATATDDKVVAGLGFCSRTNRYKALRIFHKRNDPPLRWRAELYDVGIGSGWRPVGDVPFDIPSGLPGFFTNHSLHWILDNNTNANANANADASNRIHVNNINYGASNKNVSSNCELICGFDFVEEKFKSITAPPIFTDQHKNKYIWSNLGIIIDCLSICAIDAKVFRPDVQVWVMEEYGVPESWSLRLSIRDPTVDWWNPYRRIQVTNILRNGDIIMLCAQFYVLVYNIKNRQFRNNEELQFPAIAHVPSLVSLEDVMSQSNGAGSLPVKYL